MRRAPATQSWLQREREREREHKNEMGSLCTRAARAGPRARARAASIRIDLAYSRDSLHVP